MKEGEGEGGRVARDSDPGLRPGRAVGVAGPGRPVAMAASTPTAYSGTRSLVRRDATHAPAIRVRVLASLRTPSATTRHRHPTSLSIPFTNMSIESRLSQAAGLNQKDKATAYQSILTDLLARPDRTTLAHDLHVLVDNVVQESTGLVIGRQVLSELVKSLEAGIVSDVELRKQIVQDTLDIIQPRIVSYEEQVCCIVWKSLRCRFEHRNRSTRCASSLLIYWKLNMNGVRPLVCLWVYPWTQARGACTVIIV